MAKRSQYVFPFSFTAKPHHYPPYLRGQGVPVNDWPHYTLCTPKGVVSVIGGDKRCGWGGDGIHTFEVWFPDESDPRWHETAEGIQAWLDENFPPVEVSE